MDISFGTGTFSMVGATFPWLSIYLIAGILALIFAFTKPGLALISFILQVGLTVYLVIETTNSYTSSYFSGSLSSLFQYAGVGLYLTLASIIVILVGSIMGMSQRR